MHNSLKKAAVLLLVVGLLAGAAERASALTLVWTNAVLRNPNHPQWAWGSGWRVPPPPGPPPSPPPPVPPSPPFPGPGTNTLLGLELFTDVSFIHEHIDVDKFFLGLAWHHMTWIRDPGDPDIITLSEGIENLTGFKWRGYWVQLGGGAKFVDPQDPYIDPYPVDVELSPEKDEVILWFDPPIPSGGSMYNLIIGAPNGIPDDWDVKIDISAVPVGGYFSIRQYPIIPEPTTVLLLGLPLGGLIWRRRRC